MRSQRPTGNGASARLSGRWSLDDARPAVRLDSRLLSARDVSELLGVPVSTVYELARSGRLPCLRIGRAVRFSQADLEAHLTQWRGTG